MKIKDDFVEKKLEEFEKEFAVEKTTNNPNNLTIVEENKHFIKGMLEARNSNQSYWLRAALLEAMEEGRRLDIGAISMHKETFELGYKAGLKKAAEIARSLETFNFEGDNGKWAKDEITKLIEKEIV